MTTERTTATWVMPHWTGDLGTADVTSRWPCIPFPIRPIPIGSLSSWMTALTIRPRSPTCAPSPSSGPQQVHVIVEPSNRGAGAARNVGVRWAASRRSPFVVFLDADDLSRPGRLAAVRATFADASEPGVVYSTFDVVDPDGRLVPLTAMTGSVAEVIEAHRNGPPEGSEVWIAIRTETGYVNHTSSTAVRTEIALAHAFPDERVRRTPTPGFATPGVALASRTSTSPGRCTESRLTMRAHRRAP